MCCNNWIKVEDNLPSDTNEVFVSDGDGSYAVAWFRVSDKTWHASVDMLEAENHDGGASISLAEDVRFWMPIITPS